MSFVSTALLFVALSTAATSAFAQSQCFPYEADVQEARDKENEFIRVNMSSPELTRLQSELNQIDSLQRQIDELEVDIARTEAKYQERLKAIETARAQGRMGKVAELEKENRENRVSMARRQARLQNLVQSRANYGDRAAIVNEINAINRRIQDPRLLDQLNRLRDKTRRAQSVVNMCRELEALKVNCGGTNPSI